jgi:hypothetical protein
MIQSDHPSRQRAELVMQYLPAIGAVAPAPSRRPNRESIAVPAIAAFLRSTLPARQAAQHERALAEPSRNPCDRS